MNLLASGLATIALSGAGVGIGVVFGCFLIAFSYNPKTETSLFGHAFLECVALNFYFFNLYFLFENYFSFFRFLFCLNYSFLIEFSSVRCLLLLLNTKNKNELI